MIVRECVGLKCREGDAPGATGARTGWIGGIQSRLIGTEKHQYISIAAFGISA